jgi:hypothetical protein
VYTIWMDIQHARKYSGLLSCIRQTNVTCTCAQYASGAFFGVIFDRENKCICFIVCYFACIKKAISWSTLTKHVHMYILILGYAVSVWLASLCWRPCAGHDHCKQNTCMLLPYLSVKHMHSVCESAALNGYVFVSQAYAFCMYKCSLEFVHICVSSICIQHTHSSIRIISVVHFLSRESYQLSSASLEP